jgi:PqqD family protein of HPr-rel-A system
MSEPSVRYRRNPAVDGAPLDKELMLFNATTRVFCLLNASATCIWQSLAETQSAAELTAALRDSFTIENESVEAEVSEVLGELERLDLVVREA